MTRHDSADDAIAALLRRNPQLQLGPNGYAPTVASAELDAAAAIGQAGALGAAELAQRVAQLEQERDELRGTVDGMIVCGEYFANYLLDDISKDTPQYPTFAEFLDKWNAGDLVEWKAGIDTMYDDAMRNLPQAVQP